MCTVLINICTLILEADFEAEMQGVWDLMGEGIEDEVMLSIEVGMETIANK